MVTTLESPEADQLTRLGRHWGWVLAYGIITLLAGVVALAWPGPTILVLAVVFGVQLLVAGAFRLITAFGATDTTGATRALQALVGVFSIIVGLYALRHVLLTLVVLPLVLGIYWIINGIIELFTALAHGAMPGRGWIGVTGCLSILAGLVALVFPAITLLGLALVLGIWLVVLGISQIGLAVRLRSIARLAE
jgi:uncharacterized membrane protein HdeD (DUF308 family)